MNFRVRKKTLWVEWNETSILEGYELENKLGCTVLLIAIWRMWMASQIIQRLQQSNEDVFFCVHAHICVCLSQEMSLIDPVEDAKKSLKCVELSIISEHPMLQCE